VLEVGTPENLRSFLMLIVKTTQPLFGSGITCLVYLKVGFKKRTQKHFCLGLRKQNT
jgi:hypothetical protein